MLNRPPPYFPQSQLSPPDPKRYTKFKIIVASIGLLVLLGLAGAAVGIYYLIKWFAS